MLLLSEKSKLPLNMMKMVQQEHTVTELTCAEFDEFIKNKLAIIDFSADWSMPCLMIAPIIEELAEKLKNKASFGRVNVEDESEIASKCKVCSLPTIAIFKQGQVVERITGTSDMDFIESKIRSYF